MRKFLLELELTNHCNARCIMCPVVDMKRKKGFMTRETFDTNIQKGLHYGIQHIRFCGLGEPLAHKDFPQFLSYAKKHNLIAELITNGSLLRKEIVQCLIRTNIDILWISFPSLTKKNYESIMKGLVFERVLENALFAIHQLKMASPTFIKVSSLITGINHEEKERIRHFWIAEGVDEVELHSAHNRGGHLKDLGPLNLPSPPQDTADPGSRISLCPWPLRQFFIGWDGSVFLCCCDLEGEYNLGNVHRDDFGDMERTQESVMISQPDLCRRCTYQTAARIST